MPALRSALCIAALSVASSLAWADNIVVNNSTFSALPAGGLTAVVAPSLATDANCPSLVFFNGVCAYPVIAPAQQQLQSDVGAQIYIALIGSNSGQGGFPNVLFDPTDPAPEPSTFALLLAGAAATWVGMRYRGLLAGSHT